MNKNKYKINILLEDIDSSMVKMCHYFNNGVKANLAVTFKNGDSYIYGDVKLKSFLNLIASTDSFGESFNRYIKDSYSYKKVGYCGDESPLIKFNLI